MRACTAKAREVVPGSAVLSMIRTATPSLVSQSASTSPVGPAPTIKTGTSVLDRLRDLCRQSWPEVSASACEDRDGVGADDAPDRRGAAGVDVGPAGRAEKGRAGDPEHKCLTDDRQRLQV